MINDNRSLPLLDGERIILDAQGAYKRESRSGWRLGRLVLTDRRVGFQPPASRRLSGLDVTLADVRSVTVEKRPFILSSRNVLALTFLSSRGNTQAGAPATGRGVCSRAWLLTRDLDTWHTRLYQMIHLEVDEDAIARLAAGLGPEAAAILWHIWHNGHANIRGLAELVEAERHSDVLLKIKQHINLAAVSQLGCPILLFLSRGLDPRSGDVVPFSWWIAGRRKERELEQTGADQPRMDTFEEDDHVDVIVELPGVREEDVLLAAGGPRTLVISAASDDGQYHEEVSLPADVDVGSATHRLNNGVLLVRLRRAGISA